MQPFGCNPLVRFTKKHSQVSHIRQLEQPQTLIYFVFNDLINLLRDKKYAPGICELRFFFHLWQNSLILSVLF